MATYPTEITQKVLRDNVSISNHTITVNIRNIEIEISKLKKEFGGYRLITQDTSSAEARMTQFVRDAKQSQINERQEFIVFLRALLEKRQLGAIQ